MVKITRIKCPNVVDELQQTAVLLELRLQSLASLASSLHSAALKQ